MYQNLLPPTEAPAETPVEKDIGSKTVLATEITKHPDNESVATTINHKYDTNGYEVYTEILSAIGNDSILREVDENGNVLHKISYTNTTRGYDFTYTYDDHGNLLSQTDADGNVLLRYEYAYDDVGRKIKETDYNTNNGET